MCGGMNERIKHPNVKTIGLVSLKVDGQVKFFDTETGTEVDSIEKHQVNKYRELGLNRVVENGKVKFLTKKLEQRSTALGTSATTTIEEKA